MSLKSFLNSKLGRNNNIGLIGEDYAFSYLKRHRYKILERGYKTKVGEIDIVAKKENRLYFIEIKTSQSSVSPYENMHKRKLRHFKNSIETYLLKEKIPYNTIYFACFMPVWLDKNGGLMDIRLITNDVL